MAITHFKFERLQVWNQAMDYGERIHKISIDFPPNELYNLQTHITKAADNIAFLISEGMAEESNEDFRKYLAYSMRSISEVVCCLHKAQRRNYISPEIFSELYTESYLLLNHTKALKKSLKPNKN